jgi:hypothetical protein
MWKSALCALALSLMMTAGTARAEPVTLSAADMEQVTAGFTLDLTVLKNTMNTIVAIWLLVKSSGSPCTLVTRIGIARHMKQTSYNGLTERNRPVIEREGFSSQNF